MHTIDVTLPSRRYEIHIQPGLLHGLGPIVASLCPHARAMLAVDAKIADTHGRTARQSLEAAGFGIRRHEIVAEEGRKTLEAVRGCYDAMLAARLDRRSPLVALGGGIVGDVAGFAAATYLRGVPLIHVPSTLLAMVDASIGGKTGVNFPLPASSGGPTRLGKNLVGAFWQPHAVLIDPEVLSTLDPRQFRCGLAESVKHGILGDAELFAFIESSREAILGKNIEVVTELIARSAQVKVEIVQEDEREAGRRALLNLGHTFAHAIEPIGSLALHHGEAVAIGLCAAADCAERAGRLSGEMPDRIRGLLESLGLPIRLPQAVAIPALIHAMGFDKKVERDRRRLILPTGLGRAEIVEDVPPEVVNAAWRAVGAGDGSTSSGGEEAAAPP